MQFERSNPLPKFYLSSNERAECSHNWRAFLHTSNESFRIGQLNITAPSLHAAETARAQALSSLNLHQINFGHPELEDMLLQIRIVVEQRRVSADLRRNDEY